MQKLLLLQEAMVNNQRLKCKHLFNKYEIILQSSLCDSARPYQVAVKIPDDELSWCLMPTDIPGNLFPRKATADGNCLYFSTSTVLTGTEELAHTPRLLAAELYLDAEFYAQTLYFEKDLKEMQ